MNDFVRPPRRGAMKARRGSLVVTAFILIVGMALMVGGIQTMLKNQLDTTTTIKDISLAKTQAVYLAEMGLNHVMYIANKDGASATDPWPMNLNGTTTYDFSTNVAMVRGLNDGSYARCAVSRTGANAFDCTSTLYMVGVGTFSKRVTWTAAVDTGRWELVTFQSY